MLDLLMRCVLYCVSCVVCNLSHKNFFCRTLDLELLTESGSAHQKEDFGVNLVITFFSSGSGLSGTDIADDYIHTYISISDK